MAKGPPSIALALMIWNRARREAIAEGHLVLGSLLPRDRALMYGGKYTPASWRYYQHIDSLAATGRVP